MSILWRRHLFIIVLIIDSYSREYHSLGCCFLWYIVMTKMHCWLLLYNLPFLCFWEFLVAQITLSEFLRWYLWHTQKSWQYTLSVIEEVTKLSLFEESKWKLTQRKSLKTFVILARKRIFCGHCDTWVLEKSYIIFNICGRSHFSVSRTLLRFWLSFSSTFALWTKNVNH